MEYAQQAHLIRAIKYAESGHLQKVERDHRRIIKAMEGKNRDALVEVVRNHLPDSRDAYLRPMLFDMELVLRNSRKKMRALNWPPETRFREVIDGLQSGDR